MEKTKRMASPLKQDRPAPAPAPALRAASGRQPLLMVAAALFLALVLLAPVMTYSDILGGSAGFTGEGSVQRQVGYVLIALLAVVAAFRKGRGWRSLVMPWPMLLALGWCWLSLAWAINADIGMRRLLLTTLAVWTSFVIVHNAGYRRTLDLLRVVLVVTLIGNFLVVLADPVMGIHTMAESDGPTALTGNWRGFLGHKNFAGAACALTILFFLFDARHVRRALRIAVIVGATFFLVKSQSKTSGGMVLVALLLGYLFQKLEQRKRVIAIPALMFLTALFWYLYSAYADFVLTNYLTPAAFTGRGQIWNALLGYANDNLLTGAGFGSFWNVGADSPVFKYGHGYVTKITVGHNGYIDLLVTIGLPGLLLAVFACVVWPMWRLLAYRIEPGRGALIASVLLFCMGHNITESSLFERDAIVGVIMMFAIAFAQQWGEERAGTGSTQRTSGDDLFRALKARTMPVPGAPV